MTDSHENPFTSGDSPRVLPPTVLVIFGATGDLTHRKLIPALYDLAYDDCLPSEFLVVGASRTKLTDDQFRASVYPALRTYARRPLTDEQWRSFSARLFFQPLDITSRGDFHALKARIEALSRQDSASNYLYYFSTAPRMFETTAANLASAGLVERGEQKGRRATRVVVEKPFGRDAATARLLNAHLRQCFDEPQIFRIDHYLAKETIQNILVFRFANGLFEPFWNNNYIEQIQLAVCESIGVEGRGSYFDQAGLLRDIVQNHMLQMLALLCIEPPVSLKDAESVRDEKVKVLRATRRIDRLQVQRSAVRGQYIKGFIAGEPVPGYREEESVRPNSITETFAAVELAIDNWRWAGVPIYLRAGKRLPKTIAEISVFFKKVPQALFERGSMGCPGQNVLAIQVQPEERISLKINSKTPGMRFEMQPVDMEFGYRTSFGKESPDAYARLLLDVIRGDATLFTRDDEIEQAWEIVAPLLEAWEGNEEGLLGYEAGSWGPAAAEALLAARGQRWRKL